MSTVKLQTIHARDSANALLLAAISSRRLHPG
jgi:hypothetical protein